MNFKKIIIATGIYPPDIGGPATYSKFLYEELPKHGFSVDVLSFGEVRHLPKIIRHIAYTILLFKRSISSDTIFAQDPVSVGLPSLIVSKILGKKFLLKIVGDYAWEQGVARFKVKDTLDDFSKNKSGCPFFVKLLKTIEKLVASWADKIIVPSKYLKKIVCNWGIEGNKIVVIYNSFDGDFEKIENIQKEEKIIISIGRLVPWKGFFTIIAVMPKIIKYFPGIKLIIAGEGNERIKLEKLIKELHLESSVFLIGGVPREKLFKYIKSASVFVLNTSYEGFSHQILEVMSLGVPIITTSIGGNPEILQNEFNGLLIRPDDEEAIVKSIERVLVDDEFSFNMAKNAQKTVAEFSTLRMINDTIKEIYV